MYPGLFSEYQYQITRAIVDYGKEPDWNVQKGLSIMFGTPLAGLEDVKALQKGLGGSSSSPSKGGGTSPLDVKVDDMLTTAQRAEFS